MEDRLGLRPGSRRLHAGHTFTKPFPYRYRNGLLPTRHEVV